MMKLMLILCVSGFYRLGRAEESMDDDNSTEALNATQRAFNLDCGGIFTKKRFVLDSAGYPNGYERNQECAYLFTGENCPTHYNFQFLDFDLEKSLGCTKDRLEVEKEDALCGSVDGIKNYFTPNGVLQLKFVSDDEIQGRGFRILVTRFPCNEEQQNQTGIESTTEVTTLNRGGPNGICLTQPSVNNFRFCCADSYNAKRFFISSPGFPYSNNNPPGDCVYHIYRANANVCRLRIHFLFYWNGIQTPMGCDRGFLEVDGKYICGCRLGLKLISAFDSRWGSSPKVIRFRNEGFPATVFSGFAIEVIQDECPRRYMPEEEAKFYYYNDQKNTVAFPNLNSNLAEPAVIKRVYFFEGPQESEGQSRDREETTYIDTSSNRSPFFPNGHDDYKCRMWGVLQWTLLAKEVLWQKMPKCSSNNIPVMEKCVELAMPRGYLQSPGYPHYYPPNLNLCYRFTGGNGFCSVRLHVIDFDVEDSFQCRKDHVIFGGKYGYCGRSLQNTFSTLDLRYKSHEDIHFITDNQICGRGFRGYYEYMPCSDPGMTVPPPYLPPPATAPTPVNPTPCDRRIAEEFFTVEVYGYHQPTCNFNVIRSDPEVCRLELTFVAFDLPCNSEYLVVNNQRFCGRLSGRTMTFPFDYAQLQMVYRRLDSFPSTLPSGLRLRITGRQISRYCEPDLEVPAERQLHHPAKDKEQFKRLGNSSMEVVKQGDQDYDVILRNDYADVCGLIMDLERASATGNLCEELLKSGKHLECVPLSAHTAYVPYGGGDKIELRVENPDFVNKLFVKEVSCGDI